MLRQIKNCIQLILHILLTDIDMAGVAGQVYHTEEEKKIIFEQVCEIYRSQSCTLESACQACGISDRTFYLWRTQNAEFAQIYIQAREIGRSLHWEQKIQPLVDRGMLLHLQGGERTEKTIKRELKDRKQDDGTVIQEMEIVERAEKIIEYLPHPGVLMFAAKGLEAGRFIDKSETKVKVSTDDWFDKLPLEKQTAILAIIEEQEEENARNAQPGIQDTDKV